MSEIIIYHHSECSKSCGALQILEESKQPFRVIRYLETPPSKEQLKEILDMLGIKATDLLRKSEEIYKAFEGRELTDEQWISVMVEHPILIERPIIIKDKKAVIGRPPQKIIDILL